MTHDPYVQMHEAVLTALRTEFDQMPTRVTLHPDIEGRIAVGPPRDPSHGDMVTNAAMVAATFGRRPAKELAEALAKRLRANPNIAEATAAAPGFVNLRLD